MCEERERQTSSDEGEIFPSVLFMACYEREGPCLCTIHYC